MISSTNQKKIGGLIGLIYTVLNAVISILYIPLLLSSIGDGEYGLYQIMGSIIGYFSVMEAPLSSSILRYYSYYKENGDNKNMENCLAIAKRIFGIISLIFIILYLPVCFFIKYTYSASFSEFELKESYIMLGIMVINLIISANNYVYIAAINANEKYIFLKLSSLVLCELTG